MKKVIYKVQRFDGVKKWIQEYALKYEKGKTILWGLQQIKDDIDPTLKFVAYCQSAICGSCGICVNGHSVLACQTSLDEMLEQYQTESLLIEPLRNFSVIRDLVVDWEPKIERMKEVAPWLICPDDHDHSHGFAQTNEEVKKFTDATDCILCGICASECTRLSVNKEDYYEPFVFNKAFRFAADSRDAANERHIEPTIISGGLWECLHCMRCVESCPKTVRPADVISWLRAKSIKMGHINEVGASHAMKIRNKIKISGRLTEDLMRNEKISDRASGEQTKDITVRASVTEGVRK